MSSQTPRAPYSPLEVVKGLTYPQIIQYRGIAMSGKSGVWVVNKYVTSCSLRVDDLHVVVRTEGTRIGAQVTSPDGFVYCNNKHRSIQKAREACETAIAMHLK